MDLSLTIPEELIARNACIQNALYQDDYISEVNRLYPLADILGNRLESIAQGKWTGLDHFTMDSPLQNTEGENILNGILYSSANSRIWQPKIVDVGKLTDTQIKTAEEYLDAVETISPTYNKGMIDGGVIFGISVAKRGEFVKTATLDNKVIILPSQIFIEYCCSKK